MMLRVMRVWILSRFGCPVTPKSHARLQFFTIATARVKNARARVRRRAPVKTQQTEREYTHGGVRRLEMRQRVGGWILRRFDCVVTPASHARPQIFTSPLGRARLSRRGVTQTHVSPIAHTSDALLPSRACNRIIHQVHPSLSHTSPTRAHKLK